MTRILTALPILLFAIPFSASAQTDKSITCANPKVLPLESKRSLPTYSKNDPSWTERAVACLEALGPHVAFGSNDNKTVLLGRTFFGQGVSLAISGEKDNDKGIYFVNKTGIAFVKRQDAKSCTKAVDQNGVRGNQSIVLVSGKNGTSQTSVFGYDIVINDQDKIDYAFPTEFKDQDLGNLENWGGGPHCSVNSVPPDSNSKSVIAAAIARLVETAKQSYDEELARAKELGCAANETLGKTPNRDNYLQALYFCQDLGASDLNAAIQREVAKFGAGKSNPQMPQGTAK